MKPTFPAYKKIGIVYGALIVLLLIALFIRWQRGNSLKNIQTPKISRAIPTPVPNSYAGRLSLQLAKSSYKVGENISVGVVFEAPGKQIDGADVILRFDPQIIRASSVSAGPFFKLMPRKELDNRDGVVKLTLLDPVNPQPIHGQVAFALVKFTAQATGPANLNFDFLKGSTQKTTLTEKGSSLNILGNARGQTVEILP